MNNPLWIWQQPNWPHFSWQAEQLAPLLRACRQAQGRLLGMLGAVNGDNEVQSSLDAMLQNIVTSSAIEGEQLNVSSVRSSLARRSISPMLRALGVLVRYPVDLNDSSNHAISRIERN